MNQTQSRIESSGERRRPLIRQLAKLTTRSQCKVTSTLWPLRSRVMAMPARSSETQAVAVTVTSRDLPRGCSAVVSLQKLMSERKRGGVSTKSPQQLACRLSESPH